MLIYTGSGPNLSPELNNSCEVALSLHVMQHIPDRRVVLEILTETYSVLRDQWTSLFSHSTARCKQHLMAFVYVIHRDGSACDSSWNHEDDSNVWIR